MDILKLDAKTLKPISTVTNYESYVWTTRFSEAGQFTLVSSNIRETMKNLPPGTFLGNTKDRSMMLIEEHSIITDDEGVSKLTVSGRGGEVFLESRINVGNVNKGTDEYNLSWSKKRVPELIKLLILDANLPSTGNSLGYKVKFPFSLDANETVGPILSVYEPNRGSVYRNAVELAKAYGFSFHLLRNPTEGQSYPIVRVRPGIIRNDAGNPLFQYRNGDVSSEKYVHNITDEANLVFAFTPLEKSSYGRTLYQGDYVHRVKMIDRTESEPKDLLKSAELDATEFADLIDALNAIEIRYYQKDVAATKAEQYYRISQYVTMYSFEVSPNARAKFGVDYDLGDIVRVQPSWGDTVQMRVDGFVRANDGDGYKEYPELTEYKPLADKLEQEEQ